MHGFLTAFLHIVEGWAAFVALVIVGCYAVAALTRRIRRIRRNH